VGIRLGIGTILRLWLANAHFPLAKLSAEVYTCAQKTHEPAEVIYNRIRDALVRHLAAELGLPITLYFKEDLPPPGITHDRYLQSESTAIYFSKGFDYLEENGTLHSCTAKIDNGVFDHLRDYRKLKDLTPPATEVLPNG
jgi:hypothetical protein